MSLSFIENIRGKFLFDLKIIIYFLEPIEHFKLKA